MLTREGRVVARIVATDMASRPMLAPEAQPTLRDIQARVRQKLDPFPETSAARSQDFLYDENGLPR
ncbi:hypothetical protein SAMN05880590_102244 [Rhizobium sp. RU35A]|nr:hypothetical protein SAMN05880590_102244 [Rhizobium sp. RU35A]